VRVFAKRATSAVLCLAMIASAVAAPACAKESATSSSDTDSADEESCCCGAVEETSCCDSQPEPAVAPLSANCSCCCVSHDAAEALGSSSDPDCPCNQSAEVPALPARPVETRNVSSLLGGSVAAAVGHGTSVMLATHPSRENHLLRGHLPGELPSLYCVWRF